MDEEENNGSLIEEDYYTFLNVAKTATNEEISNAYRRLSRLYHPDKHLDPNRKKEAEILFNKTKKAYEVLSDAHERAIYDSLGIQGLRTEGWEIVQRTRTPQEIREEYERLAREREERKLQQRTNPKGNITVNINATELFTHYTDEYDDFEDVDSRNVLQSVEVSGMSFSQAIEAPLTLRDTMTMSGQLSSHNGNGSGSINFALRRLLSEKGWAELDIGAGSGLVLSLRGFRTLSKHTFTNLSGTFQFTPHGIRPGLVSSIAMQLDKHTVGYVTWKGGAQNSMTTTVVRNTQHSHFSVALQLGIPHTFASVSYEHKLDEQKLKIKGSVKAGTFGFLFEYGAEKKISRYSTVGAVMAVGVPMGVTLRVKVNRANQTYLFPIHLCDELVPSPIFYGTLVPLVVYFVTKRMIIDPYVREQKRKEAEKQKELNKTRTAEKQREARAAVDLMSATFARVRGEEEARKGLVITKALYGRLVANSADALENEDPEVIDVSIPLQCLVQDSKLVLHEASKSQLPGFYDPCVGDEKSLLVHYLFHEHLHQVTVGDLESLRIPKQSHRVNPP